MVKRPENSALNQRFCLWHKELINYGLAPNRCDQCTIKTLSDCGLSFLDPKNVTLNNGITVQQVISYVGQEHWQLIKDDPDSIAEVLEQFDVPKENREDPVDDEFEF